MNGFTRDRVDPRTLQVNQGTIEDHVNDGYYKKFFSPSMMAANTPAIAHTERYEYAIFTPASSADRLIVNWAIPPLWISGNVEMRYYFSGSAAAGGRSVRWNWIGNARQLDGDINATVDVNVSIDVVGPTVANTITLCTFTSYLAIAPEDVLLGIRVLREGAHANDTYTGDAYFLGCMVRFIPGAQAQDSTGRVLR